MKEEFLKCLNVIYKDLINGNLISNNKAAEFVKSYIYYNPNDNDVITIKNWITNNYQKILLDDNFINALSQPNDLKYRKVEEIYKYLPFFHNHTNYMPNFYKLINTPPEHYGNIPNFYNAIYWLSKEQNNCFIKKDQIEKINQFSSENRALFYNKNVFNIYDDFDTECLNYKTAFQDNESDDFKKFKEEILSDELIYGRKYTGNINSDYAKKKLGVIGENYIYNILKQSNITDIRFTARDLGNGFGYDIYYNYIENNIIYENLVEVKTTSLIENDYFYMSEREYNIMMSTQNRLNSNYYIARVFLNNSNNLLTYNMLFFNNNKFKSINSDLEYELEEQNNGSYYFKRITKGKTLTLN